MRNHLLAIGCLLTLITSASASVIYLPVTYEYGSTPRFYYGGDDAAVLARAERAAAAGSVDDRMDVPQPIRTYTDDLPFVPDASIYGFTASDARDQAYRAVPRYFRMSDLLLNGRIARDGTVVVAPTTPGTIEITAWRGPHVLRQPIRASPTQPTTRPATQPASDKPAIVSVR